MWQASGRTAIVIAPPDPPFCFWISPARNMLPTCDRIMNARLNFLCQQIAVLKAAFFRVAFDMQINPPGTLESFALGDQCLLFRT